MCLLTARRGNGSWGQWAVKDSCFLPFNCSVKIWSEKCTSKGHPKSSKINKIFPARVPPPPSQERCPRTCQGQSPEPFPWSQELPHCSVPRLPCRIAWLQPLDVTQREAQELPMGHLDRQKATRDHEMRAFVVKRPVAALQKDFVFLWENGPCTQPHVHTPVNTHRSITHQWTRSKRGGAPAGLLLMAYQGSKKPRSRDQVPEVLAQRNLCCTLFPIPFHLLFHCTLCHEVRNIWSFLCCVYVLGLAAGMQGKSTSCYWRGMEGKEITANLELHQNEYCRVHVKKIQAGFQEIQEIFAKSGSLMFLSMGC